MPVAKTNDGPLTKALKAAVRDSGLSFHELERQTGVLRQSLMKFMAGETGLQLSAADKLATYFRLDLRPAARPSKTKRKAR